MEAWLTGRIGYFKCLINAVTREVDLWCHFRRFLGLRATPTRENSDSATHGDAEKKQPQTAARDLREVLPGSDIGMHPLGVDYQEATSQDAGNKTQHIAVAVETLRPTLPRGVRNCHSYRWDPYEENEQQ